LKEKIKQILKPPFVTPKDWLQVKTIDLHTCGEPLRVIVEGLPPLLGDSVLDYRRDFKNRFDYVRKLLIHEPRGHKDMYGCVLTEPNDGDGHFGVIFFHNQGYSTMCGHAIIALTSLICELNLSPEYKDSPVFYFDAPCGRIESWPIFQSKEMIGAGFLGIPSFVLGLDYQLEIPGLGKITFDIAYGGAFYAYVNLTFNNLEIDLEKPHCNKLIEIGTQIKNSILNNPIAITHPYNADMSFLYGTIFFSPSTKEGIHSKNVCVFANQQVDRSPTGSGLSGRLAIMWKRKEIKTGQKISVESILGTVFTGSVTKSIEYGKYMAIIPTIEGTAHITGMHAFLLSPNDPFPEGFELI